MTDAFRVIQANLPPRPDLDKDDNRRREFWKWIGLALSSCLGCMVDELHVREKCESRVLQVRR
jgi:hypothetical protein